jgi:hypothetical protein
MSQVVDAPATEPVRYSGDEQNQFEYRPVPVHAVVAVTLGVLSATSLLSITGVGVAFLGFLISGFSLWRIRASGGVLGGTTVAACGLALSVLFLAGGAAYQSYMYKTEVPDGYQRISFTNDISRKGFVVVDGRMDLHDDVKALLGKDLFLKGFIYPPPQQEGLHEFLLVKDSGTCCFGGQPRPQDMIGVVMDGDQTIDYYNGMVAVAGTLQLNPHPSLQSGEPIYMMTCRIVTKAKTSL